MEESCPQWQNGSGPPDHVTPDSEYEDVIVAPPPVIAGQYAVINVDRIQSDDVYQALVIPEAREPAAALTGNGHDQHSRHSSTGETPSVACSDQIVKEIQCLKGTTVYAGRVHAAWW